MRVNPDPADLFGLATEVDLVFEKIRDSEIIKRDKGFRAVLPDQFYVLHKQQIVRC